MLRRAMPEAGTVPTLEGRAALDRHVERLSLHQPAVPECGDRELSLFPQRREGEVCEGDDWDLHGCHAPAGVEIRAPHTHCP